ncbi:hypothetical protein GQ42DRAFT_161018 [Ramicandelaber brevisporus]|nr:hypothetical protein GQ42DRAFT_161018 [Ramicandelaber brevisporus]
MRGLYRVYQLLIVFLRFDLFFFLSFSIQYLALVIGPLQKTSDIAIHASVSVGCGLGLIILIYYAVRHESRAGTLLFIVGALGLVGYFGFKVWQLYTPDVYYGESKTCLKQCWPKESGCNYLCADKYQSSRIILTLFISVDIILAFLTCGVAFGAYRNFGRGLRYHLTRKSSGRNGAMQQAGGRRGGKDQPEMAEGSKPGRVRRQVNWKSASKDNVNRASANSTSVPEGRRWSITQ